MTEAILETAGDISIVIFVCALWLNGYMAAGDKKTGEFKSDLIRAWSSVKLAVLVLSAIALKHPLMLLVPLALFATNYLTR